MKEPGEEASFQEIQSTAQLACISPARSLPTSWRSLGTRLLNFNFLRPVHNNMMQWCMHCVALSVHNTKKFTIFVTEHNTEEHKDRIWVYICVSLCCGECQHECSAMQCGTLHWIVAFSVITNPLPPKGAFGAGNKTIHLTSMYHYFFLA